MFRDLARRVYWWWWRNGEIARWTITMTLGLFLLAVLLARAVRLLSEGGAG